MLRQQIAQMLEQNKERKFTQSIDLQIMLRDFDPMKEKRLNSLIDLPHKVRTNLKVRLCLNVEDCYEFCFAAKVIF